jgi:hypothetical protein
MRWAAYSGSISFCGWLKDMQTTLHLSNGVVLHHIPHIYLRKAFESR